VLLPFIIGWHFYFIHHFHGLGSFSGFNPFTGLHIVQILLFIAVAFVVLLVICALYMLVHDFALPFLALEDLGISHSLERMRALFAAEPGQFILYIILRIVLGILFTIAAEIAVFIVLFISLIPPGIIGFILWLSLHKAGTAGIVVLIGFAILGGLIFLCWAICVAIAWMGSLLTFFQAYALYFLGGRYPLLGDLLDRSTPPPTYAAAFPAPTVPAPTTRSSWPLNLPLHMPPSSIRATLPSASTYSIPDSGGPLRPLHHRRIVQEPQIHKPHRSPVRRPHRSANRPPLAHLRNHRPARPVEIHLAKPAPLGRQRSLRHWGLVEKVLLGIGHHSSPQCVHRTHLVVVCCLHHRMPAVRVTGIRACRYP